MRVHILGICGTFMGGVARIARELGHTVSGSDANVYPPMSDQLAQLDVALRDGYHAAHLEEFEPDVVLIGNALSRGNPVVEAVLDRGLHYVSGAQWLAENVLADRWVVAIAGTHGKTTTASLSAWILDEAGLDPGFLIGGVPENFGVSARLGSAPYFVIEADEYDTAFFDKRSKFVHYRPRTLVLHNLEFDHADIFADLDAIKRQFHHLVRTVPGNGEILVNNDESELEEVLRLGCWTPVTRYGVATRPAPGQWHAGLESDRRLMVSCGDCQEALVDTPLLGRHNAANALAAILAARHAGIPVSQAGAALSSFRSVKRRLELIGEVNGVRVYDDFAHHPTAIRETLAALRTGTGARRVLCVLEPRSNTMRRGAHDIQALKTSLASADKAFIWQRADLEWDPAKLESDSLSVSRDLDHIVTSVSAQAQAGDHIVVMSNGSFEGFHQKLLESMASR